MFPSTVLWEAISQPFKRAQGGLFHGKMKQYGNNVPFSKHKTRRTWLPNIQQKRIPSEILGETVKLKLTTRALKTIKKQGGLDNYLNTTPAKLLGDTGMHLRMRMLAKLSQDKGRPETEYKVGSIDPFTFNPKIQQNVNRLFWDAEKWRRIAAHSLRKEGFASADETIEYLEKLRKSRRLAIRKI